MGRAGGDLRVASPPAPAPAVPDLGKLTALPALLQGLGKQQ